jgi:photosystem II stability/assembly factor-like uncharacterized protein
VSTLLHSTDGGVTLVPVNLQEDVALRGICFFGADGWVFGESGVVRHTSDSGRTWEPQTTGVSGALNAAAFPSETCGWIVGQNGLILRTTDGGATFDSLATGTDSWLHDVEFTDDLTACAVGDNGTVIRSTDGGESWRPVESGVNGWLSGLAFASQDNGWAVGTAGIMLHTTDGGATWESRHALGDFDLYDASFGDAAYGWAVGYDLLTQQSVILSTTDGGESWIAQDFAPRCVLQRVEFVDRTRGWAVGDNGMILRFTFVSFAPEPGSAMRPLHFALGVYPNPFNASASLTFVVPARQRVRLGVFDVTGRLVCTLADGFYEVGSHDLRFDASALPSGIYFARVTGGTANVTQKLVLLK